MNLEARGGHELHASQMATGFKVSDGLLELTRGELAEVSTGWCIGGVKTDDLMRDPYFAAILMRIEGLIHDIDLETRNAGTLSPKDSAVKSALRKAELAMGGKKPATKPKGEVEEWVAALSAQLVEIGRELAREGGLTVAHFVLALKATQDSLDTRREMAGQARGYLDFLEEFMRNARGEGRE